MTRNKKEKTRLSITIGFLSVLAGMTGAIGNPALPRFPETETAE